MKKPLVFCSLIFVFLISSCFEKHGYLVTIQGTVSDKESETPIANAEVMLNPGNMTYMTDGEGCFEFLDLSPEQYSITVKKTGYKNKNLSVEIGRTVSAVIQLEKIKPELTVSIVNLIPNQSSALLKGKYVYSHTIATEVGFSYGTDQSLATCTKVIGTPDSTGGFTATIKNLKEGEYYVQAYAKNGYGTEVSGIVPLTITTIPLVSTLSVTNVSVRSATLNGKVEYPGDPVYTEKGFVYSAAFETPTVDDPNNVTLKVVASGTSAEFNANIAGLTNSTTYYARAYITNEKGTIYGKTTNFTTETGIPIVTTLAATNITTNSAILSGRVDYPGDPVYTEKGFVYSAAFGTPTVDDPSSATIKAVVSGTNEEFNANITNLTNNTTYYARAYITNENITVYGDSIISFTTETGIPLVTTLAATNVTTNSAILSGRVDYPGDPVYTEKGFVYSATFETPTVEDPSNATLKVIAAGMNTDFNTNIENLTRGTTYYVRAYVTNESGTVYGDSVISFTTETGDPVIVTLNVTNITANTATFNGRIEYPGDPVYTEKGFVYSATFETPTVDDPSSTTLKAVVSGTSAEYSANITNLTNNVTYYFRAYITNENGTVYGKTINFIASDYWILKSANLMVQKNDLSSGADWTSASELCKSSRVGGYADWRLPTINELEEIYNNQSMIGKLAGSYWSQTNTNYYETYYFKMDIGRVYSGEHDSRYRVRAVRSIN